MKILQTVSAWLAKWTPLVVSLTAVLSYFERGLFGWVRGDAQTAVLGVIMLTMGMTLKGEDFRILASRPLDIAVGAFAQYTIMPLVAFGLVHALGLPRPVAAGLILVGCCPGGVSSNIMSFLCKGDVVLECKAVTALLPVHRAQLFNYMRLLKLPCGIIVNFFPPYATIERYFYDAENNVLLGADGKPFVARAS
jgi:BASS family bile acid:Na+ symporter